MARIRWPFAIPKRDERRDGANDIDRRFQCVRIQRNASGDPLGGELQAQRNHTDAEAAPSGFYRARHRNEAAPWPVIPNSAEDGLPPSPCFGKNRMTYYPPTGMIENTRVLSSYANSSA
jgi:hypothetical protein